MKINAMTGGSATFGGKITATTGAANAIDLTSSGLSTINFNGGLKITTTSGIGLNATNIGKLGIASTSNDESITTGTGQAVNFFAVEVAAGGISFDSITTGVASGYGLNLDTMGGGLFSGGIVTIGGASADALRIVNATNGFTFTSATIDGAAGHGIALIGSNGAVNFDTVDIDGVSGRGIDIENGTTKNVTIGGGTIGATTPTGGIGVYIDGQAATSTIALGTLAVTGANADTLAISNSAGTVTMTGGSLTQSGASSALAISGGTATTSISIGAAISSSGTGQAVKIDGTAGAVTISGNVTTTAGAQLFNIGSTTAPTGGAIKFTGASLTATGGGGAVIGGLGAGATFDATGALSISGATGTGLALSNVAGSATFGATTVTNVGLNATGVSVSGTNAGTVSFASLGIDMTGNGLTGISFAGAVINGTFTAKDFDLTSASSTGTTAVNLSNTTGTGTIQLGDPGAAANTSSSTIGGSGAGPAIGFQFTSTTAVNFIYGDGEGTVDKPSTVKAVDIFNSVGGVFPTSGTYNFKDVDGANGGFVGDISEAQGPTVYYVDQNGTGDGTAENPGSIAGAEASHAKVIVLVDTNTAGHTSDLIDLMLPQQFGPGNNTLELENGQVLIGLKAGDAIDVAPLGAVGGGLGNTFSFSGINSSTIITAGSNVDTVLATLTTANGNTVQFSGSAAIYNVLLSNTGSGVGVSGTNVTNLILGKATIAGGGGGALSLKDGIANSTVALSDLILSATGGDIAVVDGSAGVGLMKVSAFSDIKLLGNHGEVGGFTLSGVTFDANPSTVGIDQVDGGAFVAGTTTNRVGGYGLALDQVAGDIKFDTTDVAVKTAANSAFGGPANTAIGIYASGTGTANVDFGTASLNVDGTGATVGRADALWANLGAGNRVGFSGVVTVNTTNAAGLLSDFGGTLFFGAAGNTVSTTGGPAISFANGTRIEDGSGGSARFGAITADGGQNGIYLSNIAASPTLLFNGPVSISNTTLNAIQIESGTAADAAPVTFAGAVSITSANQGGVKWLRAPTSTDTLTFSGGLSIQNSNGIGFFADGGAVALSGSTVSTTNGTGVSINNAVVSGAFTSVSATFSGAANGINLQNLSGSLSLGIGTLTNNGSGAAFNVGSGVDLSGGNAVLDYGGNIVSAGTGAAVSIQELTGGSVVLSGDLTDTNAAGGGQIVVANINNGTAATVTLTGIKQISSGATDAVSLTGNTNGAVSFSNGGLAIITTSGAGFAASGGGTVSVISATNSIATTTGTALNLNGVTVGAGGVNFNAVTVNGATTGIALNNVASSGGGAIALGTVNLQGITSRGVDVSGTLGAALSFNDLDIGLNNGSAVAFDLNGAIVNADITANDFDVTSTTVGSTIAIDLSGATDTALSHVVRLGDTNLAGNSSSITGVNTGVLLSTSTKLAFTYGDGDPADKFSTISANIGIDATNAPGAGTYNFKDVDFLSSPGLGFGVGKIYFVDSDGATGGGDGSGKDGNNPMTLAAAEAAAGINDIIILVNNGIAITAFSTNADNTLKLKVGEQVRGFGNGGAVNLALSVPSTILLASSSISVTDPTGNGAATLTTNDGGDVITLGASGNIIDGFILDGNDGVNLNAAHGIKDNGSGATGTLIDHMTIRNFTVAGVEILPSNSTTIDHTIFSGNASDVIVNAFNTSIGNVTSTGATGIAFDIRNASGLLTALTNVSITTAASGTGIVFGGGSGPAGTITGTNVDVSGGTGGGVTVTGGNATITFDSASSVTSTGTAVSITGRTGGSFGFAGTVTANGGASGIIISGATAVNTVSFGTVNLGTGTPMAGTAVSINNGGTASTISFANLAIATNSANTAFTATNGGTVNVTTGSISAVGGQAINLNGVAAGIALTSTSSSGGTNNVKLTGVTGTVNLGGGALNSATGTAFDVSGGSATVTFSGLISQANAQRLIAVANTTGGSVNFTTATANGLNATSGTGILIDGAAGNVTVNNAKLAGTRGIEILGDATNNASGIFTFNNVAIQTGSGAANHAFIVDGDQGTPANNDVTAIIILNNVDITNPGGNVASIQGLGIGGSVNFDSASTITRNDGGLGIVANSNAGGTINFGGSVKTLTTGGNTAVNLTNNTGTAINFTGGGLVITTTSGGNGFDATGGGIVTVQGTGNIIASTTSNTNGGTALNVVNTTIGASGLTFRSISSTGSTDNAGIVLDNTGSSGGLTVTGTGAAASGGTISGKTGGDILTGTDPGGQTTSGTDGTGIFLRSTSGASFTNMQLNDFSNFAIYGNNVTGFTLANSTINGANGDTNAGNREESSIRFDNLLGTASITGSSISGGFDENIDLYNTSGTLTRLTMNNNAFGLVGSTGNDNVRGQVYNSATANYTLTNSTFAGTRADFIAFLANNNATMDAVVRGNTFHNGQAIVPGGGTAVDIRSGSGTLATAATTTFDISHNTLTDGGGNAFDTVGIFVAKGKDSGTMSGTIASNAIGPAKVGSNSDGIFVRAAGAGTLTTLIQNNTITGYGNAGIHLQNNDGSSTMNASIFGNTESSPNSQNGWGIFVDNGATGTDTSTMNLVLGSSQAGEAAKQNTFVSRVGGVVDVGLSNFNASTHFNLSTNGSGSGTATGVVQDDNVGLPTVDTSGGNGTITLVGSLPTLPPPVAP
ncbi:MAG: hypothetical protein ABIQ51_16160 [Mesorhizobium sp.]